MNQNQLGGTMNRPMSNAGAGYRPGSQARGTSYGPQAGVGQSLNTQVEVNARPVVMREGMKGMTTSAGRQGTAAGFGPGRQVIDRSYYIGLLRPKVAELTAEIERLRQQEDQINKNSSTLVQLQQKHRTLQDEITQLKGTMADVNFAVEKMTTTNAEEINQQALQLHQSNAEQSRAADKLFLQAKEVKNATRNQENELQQAIGDLEARLQAENQDLGMYRTTRDENYRVADSVMQTQHEIRSLVAKQDVLMASLSQDADKKRAATILLDILKKRQQRDEMNKECSISVEEERQKIIQQAKTTTADIDVLTRQANEARDTVQETKNRIAAVKDEMNEYSGDNARKYQELQEKDKEMTTFMETFPENERKELEKIREVEKSIVGLLERISRVQNFKDSMPAENTAGLLNTLTDELVDKEEHLRKAQLTHQRLEKELVERKEEFNKIETLDNNITSELQSIAEKVEEQQTDIIRYSDIDTLQSQIDKRKKQLTSRKQSLLKQRDNSKQHVQVVTSEFEGKKAKLNEQESHQSLASQEQKLRLIWQSAFALQEFIRMKEKDSQYTNTKAECLRIVDDCNSILRDPKRFDQQGSAGGNGNVMFVK